MSELLSFITTMALRAGDIASRHQREPANLGIEAKGPLDFVTVADKAVERSVIDMILVRDPTANILGEEGGVVELGQREPGEHLWIVDPIDGTANYMHNLPWWSVSIALLDKGRPRAGVIHAPAMGVTLATVYGEGVFLNGQPISSQPMARLDAPLVMSGASPLNARNGRGEALSRMIRTELGGMERQLGCGTASLLHVLLGKADLYVGLGERVWDVCAASIIAENLGFEHSIDWNLPADTLPFDFVCGNMMLTDRISAHLAVGLTTGA